MNRINSKPNSHPEASYQPPKCRVALFAVTILLALGSCFSQDARSFGVVDNTNYYRDKFGDSFLELSEDDPRPGLLIAESQHDISSNAFLQIKYMNQLNRDFDVKYKSLGSLEEICDAIKTSPKKIAGLFIHAHGTAEGIYLSASGGMLSKYSIKTSADCYDNLEGPIILASCSTGAPGSNFAKTLAVHTDRVVVAPRMPMYGPCVSVNSVDLVKTEFKFPTSQDDIWYGCLGSPDMTSVFDPEQFQKEVSLYTYIFSAENWYKEASSELGLNSASWEELNVFLQKQLKEGETLKKGDIFYFEKASVEVLSVHYKNKNITKIAIYPYPCNTNSPRIRWSPPAPEEVF